MAGVAVIVGSSGNKSSTIGGYWRRGYFDSLVQLHRQSVVHEYSLLQLLREQRPKLLLRVGCVEAAQRIGKWHAVRGTEAPLIQFAAGSVNSVQTTIAGQNHALWALSLLPRPRASDYSSLRLMLFIS